MATLSALVRVSQKNFTVWNTKWMAEMHKKQQKEKGRVKAAAAAVRFVA